MPDIEEQLRRQLAEISDPVEKLDLMIELAYKTRRSDPPAAQRLATKSLRLARARNDRSRIAQSTLVLGFCEYFQASYSIALKRFQQAMKLAEELHDTGMQARSHYGLGITYTNIRDFPPAIEALSQALQLAEAHTITDLLGHIHNGMGMVFAGLSDFTRARRHYRQGLEIFEALHDSAGELLILNNIGWVYKVLGDDEEALDSFLRSNSLAVANNDLRAQAHTLLNIGDLLHRQGKPTEALEYFTHALELSKVLANTYVEAYALSAMGAIHINKSDGDLDAAFSFCQQAVEIAQQTGEAVIWQYMVRVGEVHHARMEYDRALEYYNKALEGVRAQGDRFSEYQILSRLSQCYEDTGSTAEAFSYHKLYTQLKEEVAGRQQQQELMQFRIRMEMERAEKDREILRLEKQSLEQEMASRMKELTTTALHVVEKNEFLDSLKREISEVVQTVDSKVRPALRNLLRQVDSKVNDAENWDAFERQFELVHHDFIPNLSQRFPELSKTELKVCALLRIDLSTKDMANILSIAIRTVEVHRRNIRRKLSLPSETNLTTYLSTF
jgi:tetratricopeptide (TPR) repeat protein/DNA-binding CsgD family transcriptional regulator